MGGNAKTGSRRGTSPFPFCPLKHRPGSFGGIDVRIRGSPPCWSSDSRAPRHPPPGLCQVPARPPLVRQWLAIGKPVVGLIEFLLSLPLANHSGANPVPKAARAAGPNAAPGFRGQAGGGFQSRLGSLGSPIRSARVRLALTVFHSKQPRTSRLRC
jgi:hypothetical protein